MIFFVMSVNIYLHSYEIITMINGHARVDVKTIAELPAIRIVESAAIDYLFFIDIVIIDYVLFRRLFINVIKL